MRRLELANLPTPLVQPARLAEAWGIDLWVKRDDASAGPEAGNKIRKLEFLLADAIDRGCDTLISCGGVQSNHARATATLAAALGLRVVLLLRAPTLSDDDDGAGVAPTPEHAPLCGNLLIDRLVGAEVRLITPESYGRRAELMSELAAKLRAAGAAPYVIAEGGSDGVGALGYVEAMAELRRQLDAGVAGGKPFDLLVHACGSGGTAAGAALGAARYQVAGELCAMAVCNDEAYFEEVITRLISECRALRDDLVDPVPWRVDARAKGPAYAQSTPAQRAFMIKVARLSGLLLDPVYTGKAMFGLQQLCVSGKLAGQRVLFLHTGGLPGLLAQADTFAAQL